MLGCETVDLSQDPAGDLDAIAPAPGGLRVTGSAYDLDSTEPIDVDVIVDGTPVGSATADGDSDSVPGHGFDVVVPADPGIREVCVIGQNLGLGVDATIGCETVDLSGAPFGFLEQVSTTASDVTVTGWAIDPDTTAPIDVQILLDGVVVATVPADTDRPDLADALPQYGPSHGVDATISGGAGAGRVCLRALNVATGDDALVGCLDL